MKYAINDNFGYDEIPVEEKLALIKKTGFDGVFLCWENGYDLKSISDKIKDSGLILQSVHGPLNNGRDIWMENGIGDRKLEVLKKCVDECVRLGTNIMICHVSCGYPDKPGSEFEGCPPVTEEGISRFEKLLDYAEEKNIIIAFENAEDEDVLEKMKARLWKKKAAGFCLDVGHEICLNHNKDMIGKYGDKLIATHIHDNFGAREECITWRDDLHILPFDGNVNWEDVAKRIKNTGYNDYLTLEVVRNRNGHNMYNEMSCEEFLKKGLEGLKKLNNLISENI